MEQITQQNLTNKPNKLDTNETNPTLVGNNQTHTQDVFRFTTSGDINTVRKVNDQNALEHFKTVDDSKQRTIENFLSRPIKVASGEIKPSSRIIFNINIMDKVRESMMAHKLAGFYAFKGRARLQVIVNSQPFQSGLFQLSYLPLYQEPDGDRHYAGFYAKYNNPEYFMRFLSGCPSTYMNLGASNMMELSVPYVGEDAFCVIDDGDFGNFVMTMMGELRDATNSPSVFYTAYLSFEDVQTYAVTPSLYQMQSVDIASIVKSVLDQLKGETDNSQSSEAQQVNDNNGGVVSRIADGVSGIADKLTAIPGVSDIAGPVSWAAKGVGQVAKLFGFSKPHSEEPNRPVFVSAHKDFNHCDNVDNSIKMTVTAKQEIEVRPFGPDSKDEMSLSYILQKPTYYTFFEWKKDDKEGTSIFGVDAAPLTFCDGDSWSKNSNDTVISNTFLSYFANLFNYWTGTIRLTFVIVGNKFYSGRLRLVYYATDPNPGDGDNTLHTYNHVIDIRDANTFTVDMPYIHPHPWHRVNVSEANCLEVIVENELMYPDTVHDSVQIMVFVSGAEDFCFAGPNHPKAFPCNGVDFTKVESVAPNYYPQGMTDTVSSERSPAVIPLVPDIHKVDVEKAYKLSIGDPITNLRTLVKRFYINGFINWSTQILAVRPFKLLDVQDNKHLTPTQLQSADMIDWVTALFRFRSGGVRIALQGIQEQTHVSHRAIENLLRKDKLDHWKLTYMEGVDNRLSPGVLGQVNAPETFLRSEMFHGDYYSMFPYDPSKESKLQVEIPYYSSKAITCNDRNRFNIDVGSDGKISLDALNEKIEYGDNDTVCDNILLVYRSKKNNDQDLVTAYRAAADDFNCGFLLGPPPTRVVQGFYVGVTQKPALNQTGYQ